MIEVSAAIIRENNKILICRRKPGGPCGTLWEFPGGKKEKDESPGDCLVRELEEELGIASAVHALFDEYEYAYPDREIHFRFYETGITGGTPKAAVHSEIAWVTPADFPEYQFCPADERVVERLMKASL